MTAANSIKGQKKANLSVKFADSPENLVQKLSYGEIDANSIG